MTVLGDIMNLTTPAVSKKKRPLSSPPLFSPATQTLTTLSQSMDRWRPQLTTNATTTTKREDTTVLQQPPEGYEWLPIHVPAGGTKGLIIHKASFHDEGADHCRVESVVPQGLAARAGLMAGDWMCHPGTTLRWATLPEVQEWAVRPQGFAASVLRKKKSPMVQATPDLTNHQKNDNKTSTKTVVDTDEVPPFCRLCQSEPGALRGRTNVWLFPAGLALVVEA